jgi:hypothetical protein
VNAILRLEFTKTRRRRVWLTVALLIGVQLLWVAWGTSRMDAQDLAQGWLYLLYQFPILNSIIMPVVAAVLASRLSDIEHRGQMLRLLETIVPAGRLFGAKFFAGGAYLLAATLAQVLLMWGAGWARGFAGMPPLDLWGWYLLSTMAVNLVLLLMQQGLSLLVANQMVPLSVGLVGALIGLFSLYLPMTFQRFVLWSYYGVLMNVRMDWDPATRIVDLYRVPVDWAGLAVLTTIGCVLYLVIRTLFVRQEV